MTPTTETTRCSACFSATEEFPCPHCGWREGGKNDIFYLPIGALLDSRYRIGRVLGQGGFGVTYQGWEQNLRIPLAIKEYLPQQLAARAAGEATISVAQNEQARQDYAYGLDRFLEEAQLLAHFQQHPGIVSVVNFFRAHNTGYMVMEYVDGITFKQYLERQGGRIAWQEALRILTPVMEALRAVHKATTATGEPLLHRDIAPDNIFITRQGQIKLLDFGAARFASGEQSRSISLIFKPGYAPFEQYSKKGKQGPWTDVHALSATFYHAITGQVPPEAHDRMDEDDLQPPSALGVDLPSALEGALMAGLALRVKDRTQSVEALQRALQAVGQQASAPVRPEPAPKPQPQPKLPPERAAVSKPLPKPAPERPAASQSKTGISWGWILFSLVVGMVLWAIWLEDQESQPPVRTEVPTQQVPQATTGQAISQPRPVRTEVPTQQVPQATAGQAPSHPIGHGGRYRDNGDGTVTDSVTQLQWMRCSVGQSWNGAGCSGEQKKMQWEEAKAQTARYAGYNDWRTPSIEELRSLVYCSNGRPDYFSHGIHASASTNDLGCGGEPNKDHLTPTLDPEAFPQQNLSYRWFWSSSASSSYSSGAWYVRFGYGYGYGYSRYYGSAVRLVRGGQ